MFVLGWYFIYAGLGLIVLELLLGVATGFDLILVGTSLIFGGVVAGLIGIFEAGLITTIVASFVYFIFGRKLIRKKLLGFSERVNVDRIIGEKGIVVKEIGRYQPGQVKVGGEIWRAESDKTFKVGEEVEVKAVEEVTVKV